MLRWPDIRRRGPWVLLLAVLLYDFGLFASYASSHGATFESTLAHWDSNWFAELIGSGRGTSSAADAPERWAFLPLTLTLVSAVSALTGLSVYLAGTLVSVALLAVAIWLIERREAQRPFGRPRSLWGWAAFLLAPGSLALHTFHTEALFLLLSVIALHAATDGRTLGAAVAVGLALWTRNQGVLLAVTALAILLSARRLHAALWVAAGALASWSLLLGYSAVQAGTPWAFYRAQGQWNHARTLLEVLKSLVMANEPDPWSWVWVSRQLYAYGWAAAAVALFKRHRGEGLYVGLSLLPLLFQGNAHAAFRYSCVLFPAFFLLGELLAAARWWTKLLAAAAWLTLHHLVLLAWLRDQWAY